MSTLRVGSHGTVFYAPQYIAQELGYFRDGGVDVEFVRPYGGYDLTTALNSGNLDMFAGNPWFVFRFGREPVELRAIAQMCRHCRYVLVNRGGRDTAGPTILVPSETPPPVWVSLLTALRLRGDRTGEVNLISGLSAADATEQFQAGLGDELLLGIEPASAEAFPSQQALGDLLGPIAWTVYCAPSALVAARSAELRAFRLALEAGLTWVATHSKEEIAAALEPALPAFSAARRESIVARYQAMGNWPDSASVSHAELNRWQDILRHGGLLTEAVPVMPLTPFDS